MSYTYISYYTKKTKYEEIAKKLEKSFIDLGIENFMIEGINDFGSWQKNTNYKSMYILDRLKELKHAVVWIDCDAVVRKNPVLFDDVDKNGYDIAFHYRRQKELLTGTIYFAYNEKTFILINRWMTEILMKPNIWEQRNLQNVWKEMHRGLKTYFLPPEYCCIFDLMPKYKEVKNINDIVIEQFQASRNKEC